MSEIIFDFAAIRKETKAFADTPPQDYATAGMATPVAPVEAPVDYSGLYWTEKPFDRAAWLRGEGG